MAICCDLDGWCPKIHWQPFNAEGVGEKIRLAHK